MVHAASGRWATGTTCGSRTRDPDDLNAAATTVVASIVSYDLSASASHHSKISHNNTDVGSRLLKLKELHDHGPVTDEEYSERRARLCFKISRVKVTILGGLVLVEQAATSSATDIKKWSVDRIRLSLSVTFGTGYTAFSIAFVR